MELEKNNNKRPCLKYELEDVKIASRELEDNHRVNIERSWLRMSENACVSFFEIGVISNRSLSSCSVNACYNFKTQLEPAVDFFFSKDDFTYQSPLKKHLLKVIDCSTIGLLSTPTQNVLHRCKRDHDKIKKITKRACAGKTRHICIFISIAQVGKLIWTALSTRIDFWKSDSVVLLREQQHQLKGNVWLVF